jgi:YVTN family beta-propeller protein
VINTATNTVTSTITVGDSPFHLASIGTKVYVGNTSGNSVSVINTLTDTVSSTIPLGASPRYMSAFGNKLYITISSAGTVKVVNTLTDTVATTISVGTNPDYPIVFDDRIFIGNNISHNVSVIDTQTDAVIATVPSGQGGGPYHSAIVNTNIYIPHFVSNNTVSIFNMRKISSELPDLVSFSTPLASETYSSGDSINIVANFGLPLQADSTMTVMLNNGVSVTLDQVSGSTLSSTYMITGRSDTPDLAVSSVESASVTDSTNTYTRTSYDLPSSVGDFEAENSFITRNLGDNKNIQIGDYENIPVGDNPYQISGNINGYIYVANQGGNDVSVVDVATQEVVDTVDVGEEPYGLASTSVGGTTYLYVANINSDDVSVINTSTNTVVDTVDVGVKPYYVAVVGTDVYVTNGASNTVSVIDANTNTVTDTIPVGSYPRGIKAHGTDIYVANYGDPNYSGGNYISVIDSLTNTVSDTIISPAGSDGPRGVTVLGDYVYVANYRSDNVSVIDTNTNEVVDTIDVGAGPRGIVGYNGKIYVENFDEGTVSVIDTGDNEVEASIVVGHSPSGIAVVGGELYVSLFQDDVLRVLDPATNSLVVIEEEETGTTSGSYVRGKCPLSVCGRDNELTPIPKVAIPESQTDSCYVFGTTMKRGSKDGEVSILQTRLNEFQLNSGIVDGVFGPITDGAVKRFQAAKNLTIDGIVGHQTREILNVTCSN